MLQGFSEIVIDSNVRSGKACIKGTRISVGDVLGYLSIGMSFAELMEDFPKLTEEGIKQALAYAAARERRIRIIPLNSILSFFDKRMNPPSMEVPNIAKA